MLPGKCRRKYKVPPPLHNGDVKTVRILRRERPPTGVPRWLSASKQLFLVTKLFQTKRELNRNGGNSKKSHLYGTTRPRLGAWVYGTKEKK